MDLGGWLTSARFLVTDGKEVLGSLTMVAMQGPSLEMDCTTRSGEAR
jgi:hypothetical protein